MVVRWYLRYPISVAQMAEMTVERGLAIRRQLCVAVGPESTGQNWTSAVGAT